MTWALCMPFANSSSYHGAFQVSSPCPVPLCKKVLPRFLNSGTKGAVTGNPNTADSWSAAAGRGLAAEAPSVRTHPLEDAPVRPT